MAYLVARLGMTRNGNASADVLAEGVPPGAMRRAICSSVRRMARVYGASGLRVCGCPRCRNGRTAGTMRPIATRGSALDFGFRGEWHVVGLVFVCVRNNPFCSFNFVLARSRTGRNGYSQRRPGRLHVNAATPADFPIAQMCPMVTTPCGVNYRYAWPTIGHTSPPGRGLA